MSSLPDHVSKSPYLRSTLRIDPKTGKNAWVPDFAAYPSLHDAPYGRTKLPDPYGYLENHYEIYPTKARNTSLEINGQMTESYHAQARIWNARGRKCNRWIWKSAPTLNNLCHEIYHPYQLSTSSISSKLIPAVRRAEENLRKVFSQIRVLHIPSDRWQLLMIPMEIGEELEPSLVPEQDINKRLFRWYYGVQTR